VSKELDARDALGELPYTLEVTSRGVDRPLTLPRHWIRNVGRLVEVAVTDGPVMTGRITAADEAGADLDVQGEPRRVAYTEVRRALIQVEFARKEG
jgi:ribosome maturation factor RimP